MSSHLLDEVARLANRIGVIHHGRIIEELDRDALDDLEVWLTVDTDDNPAVARAARRPRCQRHADRRRTGTDRRPRRDAPPRAIAAWIVAGGRALRHLSVDEMDLERHFTELVGVAPPTPLPTPQADRA